MKKLRSALSCPVVAKSREGSTGASGCTRNQIQAGSTRLCVTILPRWHASQGSTPPSSRQSARSSARHVNGLTFSCETVVKVPWGSSLHGLLAVIFARSYPHPFHSSNLFPSQWCVHLVDLVPPGPDPSAVHDPIFVWATHLRPSQFTSTVMGSPLE